MVSLRRQRALRVAPQPERLGQIRRPQSDALGELGGNADVLRHQRELESGGECARQDLLRDLALGGAVLSGGCIDRFQHRFGIEAERLRHQQDFEAGERACGAEIVVERLHRMAGAERPAMEDGAAHLRENGPRALHVGIRAADHDGERRVLRLRDRAGHRRIHHRDAVRRERAAERPRARRIGRAHVDDERAFTQVRHGFQHHVSDHAAVRQHGDDDIGFAYRRAHGRGVAMARAVERPERIAGRPQMGAHWSTHGAQPDERYSFDAKTSFAQRNATTAAGTPQ